MKAMKAVCRAAARALVPSRAPPDRLLLMRAAPRAPSDAHRLLAARAVAEVVAHAGGGGGAAHLHLEHLRAHQRAAARCKQRRPDQAGRQGLERVRARAPARADDAPHLVGARARPQVPSCGYRTEACDRREARRGTWPLRGCRRPSGGSWRERVRPRACRRSRSCARCISTRRAASKGATCGAA